MVRKFLAIILAAVMFQLVIGGTVYSQSGNNDQLAAKARADVSSLGTGKRVELKLRDNSKLNGHIIETTQDSFTIADSKSATTRTVAYADVAKMKKAGGGGGFGGGSGEGAGEDWIGPIGRIRPIGPIRTYRGRLRTTRG